MIFKKEIDSPSFAASHVHLPPLSLYPLIPLSPYPLISLSPSPSNHVPSCLKIVGTTARRTPEDYSAITARPEMAVGR